MTFYDILFAECTICDSGFYCSESGMSDPVKCPEGKYCIEGSSIPEDCPAGFYRDEPAG